jgi:hypothetical protein
MAARRFGTRSSSALSKAAIMSKRIGRAGEKSRVAEPPSRGNRDDVHVTDQAFCGLSATDITLRGCGFLAWFHAALR